MTPAEALNEATGVANKNQGATTVAPLTGGFSMGNSADLMNARKIMNRVMFDLDDDGRAKYLSAFPPLFGKIMVTEFVDAKSREIASFGEIRQVKWIKTKTRNGVISTPLAPAVLVPISKPFKVDSESIQVSWTFFKQDNVTDSTEVGAEFYLVQEASFGIEIVPKVFSLSFKEGFKEYTKKSFSKQSATAVRIGQAISKTYKLEKYKRNCMVFAFSDYELTLLSPGRTQTGYGIVQSDVGPRTGALWPYANTLGEMPDDDQAYAAAADVLDDILQSARVEVARHALVLLGMSVPESLRGQ